MKNTTITACGLISALQGKTGKENVTLTHYTDFFPPPPDQGAFYFFFDSVGDKQPVCYLFYVGDPPYNWF